MANYYLICPYCSARIELTDSELEELFRIAVCPNCERIFDYDPKEILQSSMNQPNH
jgi:DNA-directed RNA polymerase subunit RPC12/RpoP